MSACFVNFLAWLLQVTDPLHASVSLSVKLEELCPFPWELILFMMVFNVNDASNKCSSLL